MIVSRDASVWRESAGGARHRGSLRVCTSIPDEQQPDQVEGPTFPRALRLANTARTLAISVVVFRGSGISANLADKARKLGIPVWRFTTGGGA